MLQYRLSRTFQLWNDAVGQDFPKLYTPLVKRVDVPDGALDKYFVLVERDKLA